MIQPDKGKKIYQAWNKNFTSSVLEAGDVVEDILLPRPTSLKEDNWYNKTHRIRLWRAKVQETHKHCTKINYGCPETYVISPEDTRVLDYLKATFMPRE